jgi:isoleucyl-tRNA synthetase
VIADGLARLLAPILSMTADEIWLSLPGTRDESVHLAEFPRGVEVWRDPDLEARWTQLRELRAAVNGQLELARVAKTIGSSLEAHVTLRVAPDDPLAGLLAAHRAELPMLFIVSSVDVVPGAGALAIEVAHAPGDKCPRCWRFVPEKMTSGELVGLCLRCADAVGDAVASSS